MGLTIHYSLKAPGSETQARILIHGLHQAAQDLPFRELGGILELSGEQCDFNRRARDDPQRWLLIQATRSVEWHPPSWTRSPGYTVAFNVLPCRVIAFATWPGEGCEASNFGLCRYPAEIATDRGPLRTGLAGWRWSSFCKTQYASNPDYGGVANFLQCHLTVIALLDHARHLGCLERVCDEGGFWEQRDLAALAEEVGSWNEFIAAFAGTLKDALGDSPLGIESAIAGYPDFEQLEAAGQHRVPPGFAALARLIKRVGASQRRRRRRRAGVPSSTTP